MKKSIFTIFLLAFALMANAQNYTNQVWATFEDEDPMAFTNIEYEGGFNPDIVINPVTDGVNKSAKCLTVADTDNHEWWNKLKLKASEGTAIKPNTPMSVYFHFKCMRTRIGENSEIWLFDGTENENNPIIKHQFQNLKAGVWEEFIFEIPADQRDRDIFSVRIMPELNFNDKVAAATYYFDDFKLIESSYPEGVEVLENVTKIFDLDNTQLTEKYVDEFKIQSTNASYAIVNNPNKTEVNPSDKVIKYNKPANDTWWYSLIAYMNGLVEVKYPNTFLHVMTYFKDAGESITVYAEDHTGKQANQTFYPYDATEWEDIVLDVSELQTIKKIFFRFDAASETGTTSSGNYYIDDVVLNSNAEARLTITSKLSKQVADNFKLYANNGQIFVEGNDIQSIEVFSVTGVKVAAKTDVAKSTTFDLPKGIYAVKVQSNGVTATRIIIN